MRKVVQHISGEDEQSLKSKRRRRSSIHLHQDYTMEIRKGLKNEIQLSRQKVLWMSSNERKEEMLYPEKYFKSVFTGGQPVNLYDVYSSQGPFFSPSCPVFIQTCLVFK